jgi:hypothetical protein
MMSLPVCFPGTWTWQLRTQARGTARSREWVSGVGARGVPLSHQSHFHAPSFLVHFCLAISISTRARENLSWLTSLCLAVPLCSQYLVYSTIVVAGHLAIAERSSVLDGCFDTAGPDRRHINVACSRRRARLRKVLAGLLEVIRLICYLLNMLFLSSTSPLSLLSSSGQATLENDQHNSLRTWPGAWCQCSGN